jgi:predicted heme/steroid binding protein
MRRFTVEELACCHGQDDAPAYVAFEGNVYCISSSFLWRGGRRHQARHSAGLDYSNWPNDAPHGPDLLERFPVVGILEETAGD